MATGVHSWSTTAASNASADANVNFAEGQAPSSLNDSSRAAMASVAKWRDDTNGSIATGGSSTAFTVTSNQSFVSLSAMDNAVIAFIPHTTSGAAPTLAVDGLTAKKIRMVTAVDLPDGVLIAGSTYVCTYEAGVGEFLLHNFAGNPWLIPLGACVPFFGTTSPNASLVLPYGQAISRTTYSTLFTMFSTTFGVGDGSTTFNIPDIRGRVIAGKDNMGGSAANNLNNSATGGVIGSTLGATGGEQAHVLTSNEMPSHGHSVVDPGHTHTEVKPLDTVNNVGLGSGLNNVDIGSTSVTSGSNTTGISLSNTGGGVTHNNVQPTIVGNYLLRII